MKTNIFNESLFFQYRLIMGEAEEVDEERFLLGKLFFLLLSIQQQKLQLHYCGRFLSFGQFIISSYYYLIFVKNYITEKAIFGFRTFSSLTLTLLFDKIRLYTPRNKTFVHLT